MKQLILFTNSRLILRISQAAGREALDEGNLSMLQVQKWNGLSKDKIYAKLLTIRPHVTCDYRYTFSALPGANDSRGNWFC